MMVVMDSIVSGSGSLMNGIIFVLCYGKHLDSDMINERKMSDKQSNHLSLDYELSYYPLLLFVRPIRVASVERGGSRQEARTRARRGQSHGMGKRR